MMFSLEANNLVDENGNSKQTQMPYFENGEQYQLFINTRIVIYINFTLSSSYPTLHFLHNLTSTIIYETGWVDENDDTAEKSKEGGFKLPWQK